MAELKIQFVFHVLLFQVPTLSFSTAAKEEQPLPLQRQSKRKGAGEDPAEGGGTRETERKGASATESCSPTPQILFLLIVFLQLLLFLFLLTFTAAREERHKSTNGERQKDGARGREERGRRAEESVLLFTGSALRPKRPPVRVQAPRRDLQEVCRNQTAVAGSEEAVPGDGPPTVRPDCHKRERREREAGKRQQESQQEQQLQLLFLIVILLFLLLVILFF